jgi:hypothetical protein
LGNDGNVAVNWVSFPLLHLTMTQMVVLIRRSGRELVQQDTSFTQAIQGIIVCGRDIGNSSIW